MKEKILNLFQQAIQNKKKYKWDHLFLSGLVKCERGLSFFEGQVDAVEIADEIKIGVWACKNNRWGSASIEQAEIKALDQAINQAVSTSQFLDEDKNLTLASPSSEKPVTHLDEKIIKHNMSDFEEITRQLESKTKSYSQLIKNLPHIGCGTTMTHRIIANSNGVEFFESSAKLSAAISATAKGKTDRLVNYGFGLTVNNYKNFDVTKIINRTSEEVTQRVDPQSLPSGNYAILFDNRTSAELLSSFADVFSGDYLYKKLSKLENKLNQKIASEIVTINDCGKKGLSPHTFDAEGSVVLDKNIIENGIFKTFIHNRYTSKKIGLNTTGNASGGIESAPQVSIQNVCWDGKVSPIHSIIGSISKGILVKELHGASASPISGDFSYGALGYLIENGKIKNPVADFTIAGNFFELLEKTEALGDDLEFFYPSLLSSFGGRSLLVSSLSVSGK